MEQEENIEKIEEKDKQMEISGGEDNGVVANNEQNVTNEETSEETEKKDQNAMDTNKGVENIENASTESNEEKIKIVDEFQYLLERSQQLFAGLRDLPPTGSQKQWQPYFKRTFEVYTKLWKYQQQHRAVLENKEYYGLKRVEIGEIASKIAQLYYHYYLRTSETNYLQESCIFYQAIHERNYFKETSENKSSALMIKKLRYYARFIVVCLLLNHYETIKQLMEELNLLVDEYTKVFKPSDAAEWNVVITEISNFLEADKKLLPTDLDGHMLSVSSRLSIDKTPKLNKDGTPKLKLQEAILVGNHQNQMKFSELTLDMFRMLQLLEREPTSADKPNSDNSEEKKDSMQENQSNDKSNEKNSMRRINPHKYLLHRPSFGQLMLYITTAFKEISDNSALLLYLSADGVKHIVKGEGQETELQQGYSGGIATSTNPRKTEKTETSEQTALIHCLHPIDLVPFTRKPMFVVIDSNNSTAFKNIPKIFNAPLVSLMSPIEYPGNINDSAHSGGLFTLFLHSPIKAISFISDITEMANEKWNECKTKIKEIENYISDLYNAQATSTGNLDKSYKRFIQDDFLRQILVRYVLLCNVLQFNEQFKDPSHYPSCNPPLPQTLVYDPQIKEKIKELVTLMEVTDKYNFDDTQASANGSTSAPQTAS
ncbi:hypothetical protein H8356DRAFT_1076203 [Neocallimastix lanati (nom. inval.)]|jgi:hypothetical protein|uniref:Protein SCAI n=1 Tax=Neocallimastix californiae TaxID=1754190 RepID=A0A1Y2FAY7_9FUNG|nr:hypothetical protein H8356DRAFT_1076203 [Neocallimastix sp. JGI-2020a]ORY81080.1 hypothetical protein LY90DRAFT_500172 [Neocallimastix californiae]|eukprot:ORY81080.1 hypothetical protein LY90DRAFT_500172 [Neocallimastix californiae]